MMDTHTHKSMDEKTQQMKIKVDRLLKANMK